MAGIAAIQAPLIMMSQNRQEAKDRKRAENDYRVNLKSEFVIDELYRKLEQVSENQKKILKAFNMNNGSILMDAQYIAETLKSSPEDHPRSFECNLYWKLRNIVIGTT